MRPIRDARPAGPPSVTRRRLLGLLAGGAVVATAGCTRLSEWLVDRVVGDVNVFNTTGERVTGSLTLVDPAGETLLDDELDLVADDGDDGEAGAIYEGTLTTDGTYAISVAFETDGGGASGSRAETVQVRDPDEEHVVVFLGETYTDRPITIEVVEDFSELDGTIEG